MSVFVADGFPTLHEELRAELAEFADGGVVPDGLELLEGVADEPEKHLFRHFGLHQARFGTLEKQLSMMYDVLQ